MRIPARDLAAGDVLLINDWQLHVINIELDPSKSKHGRRQHEALPHPPRPLPGQQSPVGPSTEKHAWEASLMIIPIGAVSISPCSAAAVIGINTRIEAIRPCGRTGAVNQP